MYTINHWNIQDFYIFSPSRNSSRTNSLAVLKRQLAAACATQSPQLRIFAPVADNDPPYKSSAVVKSISSSPDLASALPGVWYVVTFEMKWVLISTFRFIISIKCFIDTYKLVNSYMHVLAYLNPSRE